MNKIAAVIATVAILAAGCSAYCEVIQPLAMTNAAIGGGDIVGTPTKGVENGRGLNNIGLLVRTWGSVTYVDPANNFFYVNDGSNLKDGTVDTSTGNEILGVRVSCENLAPGNAIMPPSQGSYVMLTCISSTFADGAGKIRPNLRPRNQTDITPVSAPAL